MSVSDFKSGNFHVVNLNGDAIQIIPVDGNEAEQEFTIDQDARRIIAPEVITLKIISCL